MTKKVTAKSAKKTAKNAGNKEAKKEKIETLEEAPEDYEANPEKPDILTRFKKGNQFWKARSTHGRSPIFKSPEQLLDACEQYFEWNSQNPLWEAKAFAFQGDVTHDVLPKMRAMTIEGLTIYIGIARTTWDNYRKDSGLMGVVSHVENVMRDQKFSGASADLLNSSIIARDLGLVDKQEKALSGSIGLTDLSDAELTKKQQELERAVKKSLED